MTELVMTIHTCPNLSNVPLIGGYTALLIIDNVLSERFEHYVAFSIGIIQPIETQLYILPVGS